MKTVKILIVEDELLTAQRIQICLESKGYATTVVDSGEKAIDVVEKSMPNLILMDIQLAGKADGITIAKQIHSQYTFPIIFITKWDDEKIFKNAKDAFPQNYITKPFDNNILLRAVELAIQNHDSDLIKTNNGIFLPSRSNIDVKKKLLFSDILYIQSRGAYSDIYMLPNENFKSGFYRVAVSSNHLVEQMSAASIIKIHRSYHVNYHKIEKVLKSAVLIQGKVIPLSETYAGILRTALITLNHNFYKK